MNPRQDVVFTPEVYDFDVEQVELTTEDLAIVGGGQAVINSI